MAPNPVITLKLKLNRKGVAAEDDVWQINVSSIVGPPYAITKAGLSFDPTKIKSSDLKIRAGF